MKLEGGVEVFILITGIQPYQRSRYQPDIPFLSDINVFLTVKHPSFLSEAVEPLIRHTRSMSPFKVYYAGDLLFLSIPQNIR